MNVKKDLFKLFSDKLDTQIRFLYGMEYALINYNSSFAFSSNLTYFSDHVRSELFTLLFNEHLLEFLSKRIDLMVSAQQARSRHQMQVRSRRPSIVVPSLRASQDSESAKVQIKVIDADINKSVGHENTLSRSMSLDALQIPAPKNDGRRSSRLKIPSTANLNARPASKRLEKQGSHLEISGDVILADPAQGPTKSSTKPHLPYGAQQKDKKKSVMAAPTLTTQGNTNLQALEISANSKRVPSSRPSATLKPRTRHIRVTSPIARTPEPMTPQRLQYSRLNEAIFRQDHSINLDSVPFSHRITSVASFKRSKEVFGRNKLKQVLERAKYLLDTDLFTKIRQKAENQLKSIQSSSGGGDVGGSTLDVSRSTKGFSKVASLMRLKSKTLSSKRQTTQELEILEQRIKDVSKHNKVVKTFAQALTDKSRLFHLEFSEAFLSCLLIAFFEHLNQGKIPHEYLN